MTPDVAIVVSARPWAEDLHRFIADHGGARVRARVLGAREALEERYDVLVAEDLTSFLTPRLVATLQRGGRRVLGLHDPTEPRGAARLAELGVDGTAPVTAEPEELLRIVDTLALAVRADPDSELVGLSAETVRSTAPRPDRGRLTAVGGPPGGPGVTEVALGLAQVVAARGGRTVLVDADEVAPSLAQRLGLPLDPNLRTAIDVVEHWSGHLEEALVTGVQQDLSVLCGVPNIRVRHRLRPGEVLDVLDELALHHEEVVADVGQHRPAASELTRELLRVADQVVGVGAPTPVGLTRLLDWLADVETVAEDPVCVVLNRAPPSSYQRAELEKELRRTYPPSALLFAPEDKRVTQAVWDGRPIRGGPFLATMEDLALALPDHTTHLSPE